MLRARGVVWLTAAWLAAAWSCTGQETTAEIVVNLRTDLVPTEEFDRVTLALFSKDGIDTGQRQSIVVDTESFIPGRRLTELQGIAPGDYLLEVQLDDESADRPVSKRPVLVTVSESVSVTVPITRSCLNILCEPQLDGEEPRLTACLGGRCVDARCTLEENASCEERATCDASKNTATGNEDCPVTSACAVSECILGSCWARPRDPEDGGACDADREWCAPEVGCFDVGTSPSTNPASTSCDDGVQNGDEVGIDCGGTCADCPAPPAPRCDDGIRNGGEIGVDCGGTCAACAISPVVALACRDGARSGEETGVDCGGSCTPCPGSDDYPIDIDFDCGAQDDIPAHECLALLALFANTQGPEWNTTDGWLTPTSMCTWHGVTCSDGAVETVTFADNNLVGALPRELGNLSEVTELVVTNSALSGSIPPELSLLGQLRHLEFSSTALTGNIPAEFGQLGQLEVLHLHANSLTGSIPPELGTLPNLNSLRLNSNRLSGSIPSELGSLSQLTDLFLYDNQLSGAIPEELGNLTNLRNLNLHRNQLSGSIPPELGNLSDLRLLHIARNRLTGSIPPELGGLLRISQIWLHENELSGAIPAELGSFPALSLLLLYDNQLTGPIPAALGNLSNLRALYLNENQLTGAIPAQLANLSALTTLWLHSNLLEGEVPSSLASLGATQVRLSSNACLWATDCGTLVSWLNSRDPAWQSNNAGPSCTLPPEACP